MKQIIVDNVVTNYFITEDGLCYNSKGVQLNGQISNSGYLNYYLSYNGIKKRHYAHRLVAQAYIPNPDNLNEVNHKDGNKMNNSVDNLEWVTHAQNIQHASDLGLRGTKRVYQFDKNKELYAIYETIEEAGRAGYNVYSISNELRKDESLPKNLTVGYYWSFSGDPNFKTEVVENKGVAKTVYQYDKQGNYIAEFPSVAAAAKAVGGVHSHVGECCRGKLKSYKGYVWRYEKY